MDFQIPYRIKLTLRVLIFTGAIFRGRKKISKKRKLIPAKISALKVKSDKSD